MDRVHSKSVKAIFITLSLCLVYGAWGSAFIAIKMALVKFSPFTLMSLRFVFAGGLLLSFNFFRFRFRLPNLNLSREIGIGLLLVGSNGLIALAQKRVDSGYAAIIVSLVPIWMLLGDWLRFRRKSLSELSACFMAFFGVLILEFKDYGLRSDWIGTCILIVATLGWSLGSTISRNTKRPSVSLSTAVHFLVGGTLLGGFALTTGEGVPTISEFRDLFPLIYLITFCSIGAFIAYSYLLANARLAVATSYAFICPIVAVLIGAALGGERVSLSDYVALSFIGTAVSIISFKKTRLHTEDGHLLQDPKGTQT